MKFEGYYFKHQSDKSTIAVIIGKTDDCKFIQVVTEKDAFWFDGWGNCKFSSKGIKMDIGGIKGHIYYGKLAPIKYDIMGIFKYFPMECRHSIISMRHNLTGQIDINGEIIDFDGGLGYIEKDSGVSFPKSYLWLQCNFVQNCSVSLSIANIPFYGLRFKGCICVLHYENTEYRLATYLGVKILCCKPEKVVLKQGEYLLIINVLPRPGHDLAAPQNGKMNRTINECLNCPVRVRFYECRKLLFDIRSDRASFEWVG